MPLEQLHPKSPCNKRAMFQSLTKGRDGGTNRVLSEEEDYGNQVVICGAVILAAASNPIKSVSEINQQISHVATHIFN